MLNLSMPSTMEVSMSHSVLHPSLENHFSDPSKASAPAASSRLLLVLRVVSAILAGLSLLFLWSLNHPVVLIGSLAALAGLVLSFLPQHHQSAHSSDRSLLRQPLLWFGLGIGLIAAGMILLPHTGHIQWFFHQMSTPIGKGMGALFLVGIGLTGLLLIWQPAKKGMALLLQSLNVLVQLLVCFCMALVWYAASYYPASKEAQAALNGTDTVQVSSLDSASGWLFDGPGTEDALMFYPGALVDPAAYAPLMEQIAASGVDCILIDMPWNMAVLDMNAADAVMNDPSLQYSNWSIGGHSLGAAMSASYAASHPELSSLVLLAGYSTAELPEQLQVLSIYGSEDGVLNQEAMLSNAANLPQDAMVIELEGANHAGFGEYGPQKGDHAASISSADQQAQTADLVTDMILSSSR